MANVSANNYLFLNGEGSWPHFHRFGLEAMDDGTLQLTSLPRLSMTLPDAVRDAATPDGPAGVAVDQSGTLYFTQPDANGLNAIQGCDGTLGHFPCVRGGTSGTPGTLHTPRGLLIPPNRRVLIVADSGNHRIQIFDLDTGQLLEIWGASAPWPASQPGSFDTPWTMAADDAGNIYVVDYGNHRVQKFNFFGDLIASFAQNVSTSGLLHQPVDIAIRMVDGKPQVLIADSSPARILIFDGAGNPVNDAAGRPILLADPHLTQPLGLAVVGNALYVGDNIARRIFRFQLDAAAVLAGEAIGYDGPIAALFLDGKNNLWVHPGNSFSPLSLAVNEGYGTFGALWSSRPVSVGRVVQWHRLLALLQPLSQNAHLDLFASTSDQPSPAPPVDVAAANPFADVRWTSFASLANIDLTDIYLGGAAKQYLWVGVLFSGDGTGSPQLWQLRVEYDWPTYDSYLPAIYRAPGQCGDFLPRLLSLFQSFYAGIEYEIGAVAALFDPAAVRPSFLPWLAGCLGLDLDQSWSSARQRAVLAQIFDYYGKRGTAQGLREALTLFAGVNAHIDEPIMNASWWALPGSEEPCCEECASETGVSWTSTTNSILGWTTMLPPAQPQGAVVGTTADLDQSHLISDEDFGSPLFTDVAYQFRVQVYRSQAASPTALATIRAVIDSEKPAHTTYELCVIEPSLRIGLQSTVGVDTVVGGQPRDLMLGSSQALGVSSVMGGTMRSHIGEDTRLGVSTRLA